MRILVVVVVCLTTLCSATLEEIEKHVKTVKLGGKSTLECGSEEDKAITWRHSINNTEEVGDDSIKEVEDKYQLDGNKLTVLDIVQEDLGFYTCFDEENAAIARYEVDITLRLKKVPKSKSIDQGSSTGDDLKCSVLGAGQDVVFKWFSRAEEERDDKTKNVPICIKSEDADCNVPQAEALFESKEAKPAKPLSERVEIDEGKEDGAPFSVLKIKDTALEDRKIYTCRAFLKELAATEIKNCTHSKECAEIETLLRVKDPLAALWPFAGIVIEVVLLCIIIFFCEKRKTAEEKEEYEERSNGNNISSNSSLRQRK